MSASSTENSQHESSGAKPPTIQVTIEVPIDSSKVHEAIDAINSTLKAVPSVSDVQFTVHQQVQQSSPQRRSFFLRLVESSPAPSVTVGKLVFFAFITLVFFIFTITQAIEKGDAGLFFDAIPGFVMVSGILFFFLFLNELDRMQH